VPKLVSLSPSTQAAAGLTPNAAMYAIQEALLAAPEFMTHLGIDETWVRATSSGDVVKWPSRVLGSGMYALVYALPDESKVLKVTEDAQDAQVAKLILDAGGEIRGLVRVFDVVALPRDYRGHHPSGAKRGGEGKFWGLVVERVQRKSRRVPSLLPMAHDALQGTVYWTDESRARLLTAFRKAATSGSPGKADLAYGWLWLHDRGYDIGDLHDGNVGWSPARHQAVLIDFGFGEGPGPEVRIVKNLTPNRATLGDIQKALLAAPNFLARLGLTEADVAGLARLKLGEGHYAQAYALPNGLVLKITDDEADARVCKLVLERGNGKPGLPFIQSVHRLPMTVTENETYPDEERPIFAIVMETVSPASKTGMSRTLAGVQPRLLGEAVLYPSMEPGLPSDEARAFVKQIRKGIHWLARYGVAVIDLHHNNFGYASGKRPVIIDFGHESLREDFEMTPIKMATNGRTSMSHVRVAFDECFESIERAFPDFGELELHQDEKAGGDNGHGSERQFGYCMDGDPIRIAFAAKTDDLPEANIRGLMAHEFGHALDYRYGEKLGKMLGQRLPEGVERRADSIAKAVFGRTIKYDGRDIQCVACQGKSVRPRRLGP
jgi:hypothetical protein